VKGRASLIASPPGRMNGHAMGVDVTDPIRLRVGLRTSAGLLSARLQGLPDPQFLLQSVNQRADFDELCFLSGAFE
jgi:hypothetical protein